MKGRLCELSQENNKALNCIEKGNLNKNSVYFRDTRERAAPKQLKDDAVAVKFGNGPKSKTHHRSGAVVGTIQERNIDDRI